MRPNPNRLSRADRDIPEIRIASRCFDDAIDIERYCCGRSGRIENGSGEQRAKKVAVDVDVLEDDLLPRRALKVGQMH